MTRDQFITEKVLRKCWHERQANLWEGCKKCGATLTDLPWGDGRYISIENLNPNYSTSPADILALQQLVMGAEWWKKFGDFCYYKHHASSNMRKWINTPDYTKWLFYDPDRFADLVAEFKGWKS